MLECEPWVWGLCSGFCPWLLVLLAECPWKSHLSPVSFFQSVKVKIVRPTSQSCWETKGEHFMVGG